MRSSAPFPSLEIGPQTGRYPQAKTETRTRDDVWRPSVSQTRERQTVELIFQEFIGDGEK
jgi:hypothetical protein